jgi:hypothetical protein
MSDDDIGPETETRPEAPTVRARVQPAPVSRSVRWDKDLRAVVGTVVVPIDPSADRALRARTIKGATDSLYKTILGTWKRHQDDPAALPPPDAVSDAEAPRPDDASGSEIPDSPASPGNPPRTPDVPTGT